MSVYSSVVLSDNPSTYLKLQETSGTVANDSSGNGHNGSYSGIAFGAAAILPDDAINGIHGVTFDGSSATVSLSIASLPTCSALTVEAWAFNTGNGNNFGSIIVGNSAPDFVNIEATNSTLQFKGSSGGGSYQQIAGSYLNSILHVVLTIDASGNVLGYRNGVQVTTASTTPPTWDITNWTLGVWDSFWKGSIAHVALYPTALSAARILAHFQAGMSVFGAATLAGKGGVIASGTTPKAANGLATLQDSAPATATISDVLAQG